MLTSDEILKLQSLLGEVLTHIPLRPRARTIIRAWRRVQHTTTTPTMAMNQYNGIAVSLAEWWISNEGRLRLMLDDTSHVLSMIDEASNLLREASKDCKDEIPEEDVERVVAAYLARREQEMSHDR